MRLINFSRNCFISQVGLVYPLELEVENSELLEKRLIIPFVGFSNQTDFTTDYNGKLILDSDFEIHVKDSNMSLVKSPVKKYKKRTSLFDSLENKPHSFLLLYSVPYDPDGKFYTEKGDNAPENVYCFVAGSQGISGVCYEMLMVLNVGVKYRFYFHSKIYSDYFCSMKITPEHELILKWEKEKF